VPKDGPQIAEIELRTPYAQVVLHARQNSMSYSRAASEKDYTGAREVVVVRVRINLTPTYPAYIVDASRKGKITPRPDDFWRDFKVRVLQGSEVNPVQTRGRAVYQSGLVTPRLSDDPLVGAEITLEFDGSQLRPDSTRVEVITPDDQTIEAEFDLDALK